MVMMAAMAANADRPDSDIGGKTAAAIERIGAVRRRVVQASATRAGLSVLQAEIVRLLASGAVRPRGTDLAVELAVSLPTVSDAVSALRRKGLVTHRPGADARSKELRLTAVGRALAASLDDALAGFRRAAGAAGDQGLTAALAVIEGLRREGMIRRRSLLRHLRPSRCRGDPGRTLRPPRARTHPGYPAGRLPRARRRLIASPAQRPHGARRTPMAT